MGLFVVNAVFGFAALLLFLVTFGSMLGLLGAGSVVYLVYALINYFVQQGWVMCIKAAIASQIVSAVVGDSLKKAVTFCKVKLYALFKRNTQTILLTNVRAC